MNCRTVILLTGITLSGSTAMYPQTGHAQSDPWIGTWQLNLTKTKYNPGLPPKFEEIISKAIEKDPKLRYQHAADLRTDLQRLKRDSSSARHSALTTDETSAFAVPSAESARKP